MFGNDKTKSEKYCYLTENKSSSFELKSLQLSVSKRVSASLAIAFCRLSSHIKNSKSTSGYPCKLKQILVDFLRAFSRGKFLSGCTNFRRTLLKLPRFSKWPPEHAVKTELQCTSKYGHLRISLDIRHVRMIDIEGLPTIYGHSDNLLNNKSSNAALPCKFIEITCMFFMAFSFIFNSDNET